MHLCYVPTSFHHIFTFIKKQSILTPDNNFIRAIEKVEKFVMQIFNLHNKLWIDNHDPASV